MGTVGLVPLPSYIPPISVLDYKVVRRGEERRREKRRGEGEQMRGGGKEGRREEG